MKASSSSPAISGGASTMTGSARSSARQISPASNSRREMTPFSSQSHSSGVNVSRGGLVAHELDDPEVPGAANVAHDRDVAQVVEHRAERVLVGEHVGEQSLPLDQVEVGQRHGAGDRVAAEGEAVEEHVVGVDERLRDALRRRASRPSVSSRR